VATGDRFFAAAIGSAAASLAVAIIRLLSLGLPPDQRNAEISRQHQRHETVWARSSLEINERLSSILVGNATGDALCS
jgi:hypothetical protein